MSTQDWIQIDLNSEVQRQNKFEKAYFLFVNRYSKIYINAKRFMQTPEREVYVGASWLRIIM